MKYSNLEADSVYGYLIWVIRFEYLKKEHRKNEAGIDIPEADLEWTSCFFCYFGLWRTVDIFLCETMAFELL